MESYSDRFQLILFNPIGRDVGNSYSETRGNGFQLILFNPIGRALKETLEISLRIQFPTNPI